MKPCLDDLLISIVDHRCNRCIVHAQPTSAAMDPESRKKMIEHIRREAKIRNADTQQQAARYKEYVLQRTPCVPSMIYVWQHRAYHEAGCDVCLYSRAVGTLTSASAYRNFLSDNARPQQAYQCILQNPSHHCFISFLTLYSQHHRSVA